MDRVLSFLISAGIIAFGVWVVAGTIIAGWPWPWPLMGLLVAIVGLLSLYGNEVRTHLSLEKDAPVSRAIELAGHILCRPILGGLHHQYVRI